MRRWPATNKKSERWSTSLKKELVLRLLRGEPVQGVSREMAVPIYKLERWRNCALAGIDSALKERESATLEASLVEAYRRINELAVEVETLRQRRRTKRASPGQAAPVLAPLPEVERPGNETQNWALGFSCA